MFLLLHRALIRADTNFHSKDVDNNAVEKTLILASLDRGTNIAWLLSMQVYER